MSAHALTPGFCLRANRAEIPDDLRSVSPVLQILSIKKMAGVGRIPDRYRVIISDGAQFMQAMLATTVHEHIDDNSLRRNVIVRCTKWEPQNLKGQR
jgi:replication factor A1